MYCPTYNVNLCMLCYRFFNSDVNIVNMENYISTRFKGLKSRKQPNFVPFCGLKLYVTPTEPFWSLWGVYYHKLSLSMNTKIEFSSNKQRIYV